MVRPVFALLVTGAALVAVACSSSQAPTTLCATRGRCANEGPPAQSDIDACNANLNGTCGAQFRAYYQCVVENEQCTASGDFNPTATLAMCLFKWSDWQSCQGAGADGGPDGSPDACAKPCAAQCCGGAETCLGAQCCPTANVCGTQCCAAGSTCFDDGAGNKKCATVCTASSQCKDASAPCCGPLDTGGKCSNSGTTWACIPATGQCSNGTRICRCTVGADCTSGSCAPHVDPISLQPVGPYVCKANGGGLYEGCNGTTTCAGNTCCVKDSNANLFCANPCVNGSQCGGAKCNTYNFSGSSCGGPTACGP